MPVPLRISQDSLFGFLTSTRLPLVSGLAGLIRGISLGLGTMCLGYGLVSLWLWPADWWSAHRPWSGALPALAAAPCFFTAWWYWRAKRLQRAATWVFVALFTLTILANGPRGTFSPAWYLHPFLALLATTSLGVIPGLLMTLVAVVALLVGVLLQPGSQASPATLPDLWVHATSLAAVTLASALAGAIVNRLLFLALLTAEAQRRKNFESSRALRHREKLLRHALRVETIGDLAGMVCHQLRNTFQVLIGHATLAEIADDSERLRRLGMIEQTLESTRPLLDQLMSMAHPDEGTTESTDLVTALRDFHQQAKMVLPGTIELRLEIDEPVPPVLLNPRGLLHALWNLVINARQAIAGPGQITLRCRAERGQAVVEVADSGCGIPRELQERIFEPYFTTKPPGQGTGLGLTAVARFVRSSNGQIAVDSSPGQGATFRMRFPVASRVLAADAAVRSA